MKTKEVYGVHLNVDAVSSLSVSAFKKIFSKHFGEKTEEVYYDVTGKEKPKKKKKIEVKEESTED
jgi:hypothetical protein